VANFEVNTSNSPGSVFIGADSVAVGPHEKLELQETPSYWTKNIQLVKRLSRKRGPGKLPRAKPPELEIVQETGVGGENG
jgi:hypothetical protein